MLKKRLKYLVTKLSEKLFFFGIDPFIGYYNLKGLRFFYRDLQILKKQKGDNSLFPFGKIHPILNERFSASGTMQGHYFHQDLHVAKLIFKNNPQKHVDIGSRIDGFVAHVASFRTIEIIDIRALKNKIENIDFRQLDLMELPSNLENYCDSISSLHAIEHFGLGRYNDPIDYFGYQKAVINISKMLKPNGIFYFSVPIGPQRIEFNAHRVFSVEYLLTLLSDYFNVRNFSFVDDKGDLYKNVELTKPNVSNNFDCTYGCGIFELIKKKVQ